MLLQNDVSCFSTHKIFLVSVPENNSRPGYERFSITNFNCHLIIATTSFKN